jgi:hypothetical protein
MHSISSRPNLNGYQNCIGLTLYVERVLGIAPTSLEHGARDKIQAVH